MSKRARPSAQRSEWWPASAAGAEVAVAQSVAAVGSPRQTQGTGSGLQTQELVLSALEAVLDSGGHLLEAWEDVTRRLRLPRPPRHLSAPTRRVFLEHCVSSLHMDSPGQFGVSHELAFLLARLAEPKADLDAEVPRLPAGSLSELLGGVIHAALLYAPELPETGWRLAALSYRLVQELRRQGARGRQLRGFDGEALALEAALQTLDGDLATARDLLLRSESCLRTRDRLRAWRCVGRLIPPASPHVALRAHALWLYCRGVIEAVAGHVAAAVACWQQSYELYLAGGLYFGAGVAAAACSTGYQWLARPELAVQPLETALQLLDRRALLRLGEHQEWSLVCLYARTGRVERAAAELHHLWARVPERCPWSLRAAGLLALLQQGPEWARQKLVEARQQADEGSMRLLVTLDLAELELDLGRTEPASCWLASASEDVARLARDVRELWREAQLDPAQVPQVRGEVLRALACVRTAWHPVRPGSVLESEDSRVED